MANGKKLANNQKYKEINLAKSTFLNFTKVE